MALGSEAERGRRNRIRGDRVQLCSALCLELDFRDRKMAESEPAGAAGGGCVETDSPASLSFLKTPVRQILVIGFPLGERL